MATIDNIEDSTTSVDAARGNEPVTSYQHNTGLEFATDDRQDTIVVHQSKSEEDWISSSESVPAASNEMDTASLHTALFVRQDNDESIPTQDPNELPIEPKITPAIGIAGAIMLGTGVALCLVGVKKSWLHIFLSTGYLASLAVTVLIIYVMNPEHSNAIQGAYMVAAVVTGLIFGAVSLVFQEVTEGLGCMLGSFCFAMWILVLAPGGIISSTAGRGILIGVITVAGFGLSFTHYTRMYALLCCTSFAGATITILGVDCFSRAGLKEFWLYLWKLNPKQFPLETNTYPITRGIRVEIACIIVVFLLGLVSQFKLWKVIKARRAKNEQERKRVEDERIEAEAAIGRDVEANTQRERADWEAAYGEKNATKVQADSCAGSSMETSSKHQYSVREREVDAIELSDIEEVRSGHFSNGEKRTTIHDGNPASGESQEALVEMGENSRRQSNDSASTDILDHEGSISEQDNTNRGYAPGAPEVVPLPFRVPTDEEEHNREAVAPSEASKRPTDAEPAGSVVMPLQKLSLMQLNEQYAKDGFERRNDQASSVAATADDVAVLGDVTPGQQSRVQSMLLQDAGGSRLAPPRFEHDQSKRSSVVSERELEQALDEDDEEALPRDPIAIDAPAPRSTGPTRETPTDSRSDEEPADVTVNVSRPDGSSVGQPGSVSEAIVEQLPAKLSRIALTYRTNEWAKHIADADHPDNAGEMERPSSPGVQVETSFPEETPKPVDVEDLQKTNSSFAPNMPTHSSSKASKKSQRQTRQSEPVTNLNRTPSTAQSPTPIYSFSRSSSQASLNRQQSTSASPARPKIGSKRQSSMQLTNQPLVESPIEDATETFQPSEFAPTTNVYPNATASTSASNLLDERNQMLQRRPTTVSFNGFRSTPTLGMMSGAIPEGQEVHQPEKAAQDFGSPTHTFTSPTMSAHRVSEDENMTLAQRRSLMQLNNQTSPTLPASPTPAHKPRASIYSTMAYDSHQPARHASTNSIQQSARLNQWRQTLEADVQAKQPPRVVESTARQNMMDGRRQSELRQARKKEEEGRRQSAIDEAMRRGHLDGAHRDAMRRMQAKANEKE